MKFAAWSFDVKVEGSNVVRFMDLTTHNHANTGGGAMTSSVAAMNAALEAKTDDGACENLDKANTETRKEKASSLVSQDRVQDNNVVAHAIFTDPNNRRGVMRSASRGQVAKYDNSFSQGLLPMGLDDKEMQAHEKSLQEEGVLTDDGTVMSRLCPDENGKKNFKYRNKWRKFEHLYCHAEARMIEDIFKRHPKGGGKLLVSVSWPNSMKKDKRSCDPCDDCHDMLCAASKCMEITICNENNEPEKLQCKP